MTAADKGRFCASCRKEVIDFTSMGESELIAFFKKPKGSVCGRFRNDQLEKDIYIRPKRVPWVKYFFQIALPVFLLSCKQRTLGVVKQETTQDAPSSTYATTGLVMPDFPAEVIDSAGSVKGEVNRVEVVDTTNVIVGDIQIAEMEYRENPVDTAVVELPELTVESGKTIRPPETICYSTNRIMGDVIAGVTIENVYDSIENKKHAPTERRLKVYPNPLARNSNAKADPRKLPAGKYNVQISEMSGKILYTNKLATDSFTLVEIPFSGLPGGMYVLRFQNEKTGEAFTERVVVQ
jgi:hypothetical protein